MKTIKTTLPYIFVLYVLPLLFQLELLFAPEVIISAIIITALLVTQPQMKLDEVSRDKKTDKGTMVLILISSVVGHICAVIEWGYFPMLNVSFLPILGAALMLFGIVFRIVAIKVLDKAFSGTLQIKKGQKLMTSGLYSKFRHPSYTGAWILMLGDAFIFQSYAGILILGIVMFFVYIIRIKAEEEMLVNQFGEEYKAYKNRSWKLLPGF